MKQAIAIGMVVVALLVVAVLGGVFYVVSETEQVVITQFGDPVGEAKTTPGLKMKMPFVQKANFFEKRAARSMCGIRGTGVRTLGCIEHRRAISHRSG